MSEYVIYCIETVNDGRRYIGSTKAFIRRFSQHLRALEQGKHFSQPLQSAFDSFGITNMKFGILETGVCETERTNREGFWINHFKTTDPTNGYNCVTSGSFAKTYQRTNKRSPHGFVDYKRIVKLCKEKNISIARLEKEAGLGNATVRGWVKSEPTAKNLKAVADVLGVSVDELLK